MLRSLKIPAKFWGGGAEPKSKGLSPSDLLRELGDDGRLVTENYPEAEQQLTQAVLVAEKNDHGEPTLLRLKVLLSQALRAQGKLAEAEETAQAASTRAARSKDLELYGRCLDEVADVLIARENFAAIEEVMAEALRIERGRSHPDPKLVAQRVYRLGLAQYRSGRFEEAFPGLEQARELYEKAFGAEDEETGRLLVELGVMYRAQAQHSQAQKHFRRAMHIQEHLYGAESQETLAALHQLAGSLEECGDIAEAAAMYERSLHLRELVVGTDQEVIAEEQFRLAGMYVDWGNHSRARELLREAIGTFKRKKGRRLAMVHQAIAHVEELATRYRDAVVELTHAYKVWESMWPQGIPEMVANLEHRAELLEILREHQEADWLREQAAGLKKLHENAESAKA
jgi:tetratricopeptide (TPR) repeat protein